MRALLGAREAGERPPLLLVHGSAASAEGWGGQLTGLRDRFHVIAVDRRGTGRSPLTPEVGAYSVAEHAQDLADLIVQRGLPTPVVCGSSFGAVITLHLARTRPELVRGVVLAEPPLPPQDRWPKVMEDFLADFRRTLAEADGPAVARLFLRTVVGEEDFENMPPAWRARSEALWPQIRMDVEALAAYPPELGALKGLRVPALMLGGSRSTGFYVFTLERLRMLLPESARLTLDGAGHMMHLDRPEAFNRAVTAFAERFIAPGA